MLKGPDVSSFQGRVDWAKVAGSGACSFGYAKATEGMTFTDPTYLSNRAGAHAADLAFGMYDFARPGNDPRAEAQRFLDIAQPTPNELPVMDLEVAGRNLVDWGLAWRGVVEGALHRPSVLYTGKAYLDAQLHDDRRLASAYLWVAAYQSRPPVTPWPYSFWQHTDAATIPGISGVCDESYFAGSLIDLHNLTGQMEVHMSQLNAPAVAIVPTSTDAGYWIASEDGGVFSYGDAQFEGSQGGKPMNAKVVDLARTSTNLGYWLLGADGGVFAEGDAKFFGSPA